MSKKIFSFILAFIIVFSPILIVKAAVSTTDSEGKFFGLVPKCNTQTSAGIDKVDVNGMTVSEDPGFTDPCDFNMLMALINNLISFLLITLATPIFALILIYVAWLYISDMGSTENVKKSKHILKNAVIGYVIALAAWLIVKTILSALGFTGETFLS